MRNVLYFCCYKFIKQRIMRHSTTVNIGLTTDFEMFLKKYATSVKKKSLRDLRGKIAFREDYDYKLMREKV